MRLILHYIYWQIKKDNQNIFWVGLNCQSQSVNTLSDAILSELDDILTTLGQECQGVIFHSLKENHFIVGADINAFLTLSEIEAEYLVRLGQTVFNKIENLSVPSIALIDGLCLGGGLELALACRYRIVTEKSAVGLPEVQLGIIPAWGGIERAIQLMGTFRALTVLLLTGKNIKAKKAQRLGLVDIVVPRRELKSAALFLLNRNQSSILCRGESSDRPSAGRRKTRPYNQNFIRNLVRQGIRPFICKAIRFSLKKRINQKHYPAPYAILAVAKGTSNEIDVIKTLLASGGTARELIRVFHLKEQLKHMLPKEGKKSIHIHVVGAGTMGADIAALCTLKGLHVTLFDMSSISLGNALLRATKYFEKECGEKHTFQATCDRFVIDFQGKGIEKADIIIEAIVENLQIKQAFFKEAEQKAKPSALFLTNTSSLSVKDIAAIMEEPQRLVGLHFFNPATKMLLVEVIKKENNPEFFAETLAFVSQIGKLPVPVSDSRGFLVNRILAPYLVKGLNFLSEGIKPSTIDEAAQTFGMLMGPAELADTIGLDICLTVAKNLLEVSSIALLQKKVDAGELGKKTKKGFFRYTKAGRRIVPWLSRIKWHAQAISQQEKMANELIEPILLEAKRCLEEKVVDEKDLLDAAMIFGAGFAPFRGGPLQYAEQLILK